MKTSRHIIAAIVLLGSPWLVLPAGASRPKEGGALPVAHGDVVRNFARITFEWPDSVYFTATAQGNSVSVTFDRKANPDFQKLLKDLYPYVKKAVRKPDGKTIVFTLDRPYRIRTFVSDNINGIDLLDVDTKKHRQPPPAKPVIAKKVEPASPQFDPSKLAALAPAAGEAAEKPGEKPVEVAPAKIEPTPPSTEEAVKTPEPAPAAVATSPEVKAPDATKPVQAQAVVENPPAEVVKPAIAAEMPIPLDYNNPSSKPKAGFVKLGLSAAPDSATLRFPFPERTALAVFVRNQKLWIVIDKPLAVDISDFSKLPDTVVEKPDLIATDKTTILRVPIDSNMYPIVTQEPNSFNWAVLLTGQKKDPESVLKAEISTEPPAPSHVFISALEMSEPITVDDPQIGDQLIITPLYKPGEGLAVDRDFIEFAMLQTAQGIVVQKKADDVSVALLRNGVRISVPKGATLTPGLPVVDINRKQELLVDSATLFPYEKWKSQEKDIKPIIKGLFHRIVEAEDARASNEARLRLAQLYLSEGMAVEAIGLLEGIKRTDPDYYKSAKLSAMQGAASFLLYRYADAARAFGVPELNGNKEVDFWRKLVADLLGHPNQNYDFIGMNDEYVSKYPPGFRQRLVIVAADRLIYDKEYNTALKVFDTINKEPEVLKPIANYVSFLMATIAANNDQEAEALAAWDKLADDYSQQFVRASAELSRIVWGLGHGDLTKDEAIERLEKLRLAWHGDRLELQVITLLGNMYEEKKDFVNAMRIWHGGITSFPNSSTAFDMTKKMQEAFVYMFSEGGADELPPIDVLAMYYEYQNYAPSGSTGNELTEKLASRLISVDLLGQAAELLDRQMRFSSEKEDRSRVGAKLATIHLLNNQPGKALAVLQDSLYGENALPLRMLRNRIAAEALVAEGSVDRALHVLGQDTTPEAERIRLNIYWQQKNWGKVVDSVEATLKLRENQTAPVTLDETESLLKLALAYIFQNNTAQLQYLRDYFTPLMDGNPYKPVFDFVTNSDVAATTTNFDEVIKNLSNTRSFIENYKARIETAGLSSTNTALTQ
ncbi:MAG: hypothetical protein ACK502_08590 [Alphaproteobacteria bacterium]